MEKPTTFRLSGGMLKDIKEMSIKESLDSSSAVRKLLAKAIAEWKKDYAIEQYQKGVFSFGQLAGFSGISIWEVPALLKEKNVSFNYDKEELEADIKAIKWLKKRQ